MGKLNIRDHDKVLSFKVLWLQEQFKKLRRLWCFKRLDKWTAKTISTKKGETYKLLTIAGDFVRNDNGTFKLKKL